MKSDRQIQKDVIDHLGFDPSISAEKIGVTVKNGIVTLTGTVPSFAEKRQAEKAVYHVGSVKSVVEEIKVELPGTHLMSDFDLAEGAASALKWNVFVPSTIKATVEDGRITLTGDVDWAYQSESAVNALHHLPGLRGINNHIKVVSKPKIKPAAIKENIEKALVRAARDEAHHIIVDVKDDKVILSGNVHSVEESRDARWAAWCVPGVSKVENNLHVT